MICSVCVSQKEKKFHINPSPWMAFVNGSNNFKASTSKCHESSECYETGLSETRHEEAVAAGKKFA